MKTSVVIATAIVCCLAGGLSGSAWSEDLESALENINISTDAQNTANKGDDAQNLPCAKNSGTNCSNSHDDDVKTTAYRATILQQAILSGNAQNVTINGASADDSRQATISISGF